MRVLHIHKLRGVGGSENHLLALLPALRERGIDARFLGLDDPEVGAPAFYAELDRLGVPYRQIVCGPDVSPRMARQVTAATREEAPDLVHTHLVHADVYGAVASRRTGVPFVSSRHNDDRYLLGPFRVIDRRFARRALRLIAISNAVRRFLIEAGHPAAKIEMIHYGLDSLPTAPSEIAPPPAGPPLLLSIGRLTAQKDHPTSLRAFAEVRERHPEAVLAILGIGPLEAETRALVTELGLDGSVLLPGRVEIRDWLDRADLFVHTARWEGFGLVLLEAMLAALPVVATRVSAVPEVVADSRTGLLVEPGDSTGLAAAIDSLLAAPGRGRGLGKAGLERARSRFSVARMADRTAALYESLR